MSETKKQAKSRIMRVNAKTYDLVKELKGERTYSDFITQTVAAFQQLGEAEEFYRVGDRVYTDLAEARGEALMEAVKAGQAPELPEILIAVGQDAGRDDA